MTVATEIADAVDAARKVSPYIPANYTQDAISAGKSVEQVKGELLDLMGAARARAYGRKSMLKLHGMTEADLAPKATAAQRQADALAALPKSLADAKGDARAFGKADIQRQAAAQTGISASTPGRESMLKEMRKVGLEPAR